MYVRRPKVLPGMPEYGLKYSKPPLFAQQRKKHLSEMKANLRSLGKYSRLPGIWRWRQQRQRQRQRQNNKNTVRCASAHSRPGLSAEQTKTMNCSNANSRSKRVKWKQRRLLLDGCWKFCCCYFSCALWVKLTAFHLHSTFRLVASRVFELLVLGLLLVLVRWNSGRWWHCMWSM